MASAQASLGSIVMVQMLRKGQAKNAHNPYPSQLSSFIYYRRERLTSAQVVLRSQEKFATHRIEEVALSGPLLRPK